ncbi:MAG TPA: NADH-quinone oxidoreductase subunit A [Candidatus Acidoferrales bacterium]|nr:NADH-quinone oxidoreductase subunit A [Candidatus Acidoferrales bacterium]
MNLWFFIVYGVLVLIIAGSMVGLSALLGERHHERFTDIPYEGGILSEGSGRARFSIKFYLMAMFFVVFDLESVFLYSYAVGARELGWRGYWEALIFILILAAALVYLWRLGALDWAPNTRRRKR